MMAARHDSAPRALAKSNRQASKRRGTGLSRRVESAVAALIDGEAETLSGAAEGAGLTPRAFRMALRKPAVLSHYRQELEALRNGERARNLRVLIGIRDDAELQETAAGQKVRIEAVKALEPQPESGRVNFAMRVQGDVHLTPGYVLDLRDPEDPRSTGPITRPPLPPDRAGGVIDLEPENAE